MRQRGDDTWPSLEEPEPTLIAPAPPAPAPPPPDRRIGAGMVLALAALALAVGGIALAYILAHRNTQPAPTTVVVTTSPATGATTAAAARVTVPYLVGLTARKAATRLADLGLEVKAISKPTPSRTGLVVSQRPRAGVQLARRQNVTVVIDRAGPQQVSAPNLIGQPLANARAILQRLGLRTVTTQVSSAEPAGTVVDQAPKPGAKLDRGWEVALSVARQGKTTLGGTTATTAAPTTASSTSTMPNVSHQTEQTAVTAMSRAGILASLFFVPSHDPLGTVEQQAKPAGTTVPYHAHAQINLSTGPGNKPQERVPNVVGRTLDDAVRALNGAQLRLIYVKYPVTSGRPGVVVQQSPLAGNKAPQNAQVLVFLAVKR